MPSLQSTFALLALCHATATVTDRASAAVHMSTDMGMGTAEIADGLGCSQRRVQQLLAANGVWTEASTASAAALGLPTHPDLETVVLFEYERHGHNYGWKMLLGALRAHHPGWGFPRRQVYAVLRAASPSAFEARRHWAHRRIGRGVYYAPHFLYSVHMDLACKLQEYNIFVGGLIDGCTRKVLHLSVTTDKLPTTVYRELFEPAAEQFGLPDQLITDKGSEWCVAAFVCLLLARRAAREITRPAHRFVTSKRNVRRHSSTRC